MRDLFDAGGRALLYCLHPRVLLWSLLPLVLAGGLLAGLGWAYWEDAVAGVRATLERWELLTVLLDWLSAHGAGGMRAVLAPLILVALAVPLVVVLTLLLVGVFVTPAVVRLVAARRFPALERRDGATLLQSIGWALACTLGALAALVCSVPLWFIPPLSVVLPPLIWGWLTYRVLAFDVLAAHASGPERRWLIAQRRWPLLFMGVVCGAAGAVPSLLWAFGAVTLIFAPILLVLSVWLYTVVFAFASCWFAHYLLAGLQALRDREPPPAASPPSLPPTAPPASPAPPSPGVQP